MASSDIPANDKGDEQHNVSDARNVETVKSKSTPPSSTESGNKRKRESKAANININQETKSPKETTVADTKETGDKHVPAVETMGVKEVEMKDAESKDSSVDHGIKEIEMKDAEVACNKTDVFEAETHPEIAVDSKTDVFEQPTKVERSERSDKERIDAGQHVLGEVATLLKQVQESDTKAKLEVEVKVKKMEDRDVKENGGEVNQQDPIRERVGFVAHD